MIDQKLKVEELTLECMKKHFAQAQGKPLTSNDWIQKLSNADIQQQIIDGTYDLADAPRAIQMYLRALERLSLKTVQNPHLRHLQGDIMGTIKCFINTFPTS